MQPDGRATHRRPCRFHEPALTAAGCPPEGNPEQAKTFRPPGTRRASAPSNSPCGTEKYTSRYRQPESGRIRQPPAACSTTSKVADVIAMKLGISETRDDPGCAPGIGYALAEATDDGHCGLPADELGPLAVQLLDVSGDAIRTGLELELAEGAIVADTVADAPCALLGHVPGRAGNHRPARRADGGESSPGRTSTVLGDAADRERLSAVGALAGHRATSVRTGRRVKADTSAAAIVTPAEAPVDPSLDFGHRLRRRPDIVPIEHRRRYRLESVAPRRSWRSPPPC